MHPRVIEKIQLAEKKIDIYSGYMPQGVDEIGVGKFLSLCIKELGTKPPEDYIELLRIHNGFSVEGVFAYSTERLPINNDEKITLDFIEMNLISRGVMDGMEDFLFFGDSDQDEYVLQLSTGKYQVRDRQAIDNICEEFETFDGLLEFMLDMILRRL